MTNTNARQTSFAVVALVVCGLAAACSRAAAPAPAANVFATPEAAVQALNQAVTKGSIEETLAVFGAQGSEVIDHADPATLRQNQQVFLVAMAEGWRLEDEGDGKVIVIGHESWPFPVPLVKDGTSWRFDTAAGKEEVIARRVGRNELAAIRTSKAYVAAQRRYASSGHDGLPAGVYAASFRSSPGKQNGLYWPVRVGQKRSPLGEFVQEAEQREAATGPATPFHGYHFRILAAQGGAAGGGARSYMVNGRMTGGFAMVAWPAFYDVSGVMTFIVNQDGVVHEKDLGPETAAAVAQMKSFDPDSSWSAVQ